MRRMAVILNARAGGLLTRDKATVQAEIARVLPSAQYDLDIQFAEGRAMLRAIDRAANATYDGVIVGGGDGSASYAAARLHAAGKVLGLLPLGTLNLLARDLGMPMDLPQAVEALATAKPQAIDLASLNGHVFHSLSGLGFFSEIARAREEVRDHLSNRILRLVTSALRALSRTGVLTLEIEMNGRSRRIESYAALVTCNRFDEAQWRRSALDGGLLEIHVAEEEGALARLKAGADLIAGGWRDNPGIHSYATKHVRIGAKHGHVYVATDGELRRARVPLDYTILPRALQVLRPLS